MTENNKFQEFYFKTEDRLLPLQVIVDYTKYRDKSFTYYRGEMYCGECREAKLNFTQRNSGNSSYLNAYDNNSHDPNCTLKYDDATKKEFIGVYKEMKDSKKIESFLHSILVQEIKKHIDSKNNEKSTLSPSTLATNPYIIKTKTNSGTRTKRLPRKLLTNEFNQQRDSDSIYVFYGKVRLEVKTKISKKDFTYHILFIKVKKDEKWINRATVYRHNKLDIVDPEKEYHLVVLGSLDSKYKGQINLLKKDQSVLEYIEAN
ncbi:hypothetical protein [Exiguobacterium sp. s63]|uniref:hypothetical protein n=1 Tax=Exiguobacterium sp. s63 TaxID=2751274 RepID=UPI001BE80E93|nr:hypothetical protein [Exiguobacterium sp. s63]